MGNVKKQIQDYYDQVVSIEGLERQLSESEDVSQVKRFINYQMKPKFQSEKDLCGDIAVELWNEYWSDTSSDSDNCRSNPSIDTTWS